MNFDQKLVKKTSILLRISYFENLPYQNDNLSRAGKMLGYRKNLKKGIQIRFQKANSIKTPN